MGHNGKTLHFPECSNHSHSSCNKLHMWYLTLLVIIAKMAAKREAKPSEKRRI